MGATIIVPSLRPAILVLVFTIAAAHAQQTLPPAPSGLPGSPGELLVVGEELEYNVSYAFFHLGKIIVRVVDRQEISGRVLYRAEALINSARGIPFVDLHIRFTSDFDENLFSYRWSAEDSSKSGIAMRVLTFEYDSGRVFMDKGKKLPTGEFERETRDTAKITSRCQDGLSLFYFARGNLLQKATMNVPTFIEKEQVNTFFNFTNEIEDEEIDSVSYPIEVVDFEGRADFVGVFGLTGGFQGRFSNDTARVPIVAWMKVILGSIKVKLVRWNRPGWVAPRFVERG
jgi:hypothetical protein